MMESLGRAHARAASAPPCDPRGSCESREICVHTQTVFVGGQTLLKERERETLLLATSTTSTQKRLPAELKHISKRRKRNQYGIPLVGATEQG